MYYNSVSLYWWTFMWPTIFFCSYKQCYCEYICTCYLSCLCQNTCRINFSKDIYIRSDEVLQNCSSVNLYQFTLSPAMGNGAISQKCVIRLTSFALTLFWPLVLAAWEILVFLHIFWVDSLPSQQILFSLSLFLPFFFLSLPEDVSVLCNLECGLVWCLCCIVHGKIKSRNNMLVCVC